MTRIASWNVNSVRARLPLVLEWLQTAQPDIALLQEIKTREETFPALEIEELGYNIALVGQKTFNGVAILSKYPIEVEQAALPGDETDDQARYIEAVIGTGTEALRVASLYLPNGNPVESEKFPYKLAWMERLHRHISELLKTEDAFVLGGDFNVIPEDIDVYAPESWRGDALFLPETRGRFRAFLHLGLTEAFRALHPEQRAYSYWDYQGGAWKRDEGLRIDHLLLSPQAADRLQACEIDRDWRDKPRPSDHVPVWCELAME
jgi:exodeoxyribonuclease-3